MDEALAILLKGLGYAAGLTAAGSVLARGSLIGWPMAKTGAAGVLLVRRAAALLCLVVLASAMLAAKRLDAFTDPALLAAIAQSPLGLGHGLQLAGGVLMLFSQRAAPALIGALAWLLSFGVVGHGPAQGLAAAATVTLHVAMAAWWLGGLLVLARAHHQPAPAFSTLVQRFSRQALPLVALLLAAAVLTAGQLLDWQVDLERDYDRGLAAKVVLTAVLLVLAAGNRFMLTPRLWAPGARIWLHRSVRAEILAIAALMATTAYVATSLSPHAAGDDDAAGTQGPLVVTQAWAPAMAPGTRTAAGYLIIRNQMATADQLVGARSPWAETVTLHSSTTRGGITRMRAQAAFDIPAHGQLPLSPGGRHLMFTGLYAPFVAGDTVPVTLVFRHGGAVEAILVVQPLGTAPAFHDH